MNVLYGLLTLTMLVAEAPRPTLAFSWGDHDGVRRIQTQVQHRLNESRIEFVERYEVAVRYATLPVGGSKSPPYPTTPMYTAINGEIFLGTNPANGIEVHLYHVRKLLLGQH